MNREQLGPTIFALLLLSFTVAHNQRWLSAIMILVLLIVTPSRWHQNSLDLFL